MTLKNSFMLFVAACLCAGSAKGEPQRTITVGQARALVMASLLPEQRALPKVEADEYPSPKPSHFLFFTVTWEGTPSGSVVVGNYAVDRYTGDVWSATSSCEEETNKILRALQAKVRATLHLSRSHYHEIKTKGPLCD